MLFPTPLDHTTDITEQHTTRTTDTSSLPADKNRFNTTNRQDLTPVKRKSDYHLTAQHGDTENTTATQTEQHGPCTSTCDNAMSKHKADSDAGTAATTVAWTPELLENIFSHLPTVDLVKASRVSKTFQALLKTSPTLRRKLFLLPVSKLAQYWHVGKGSLKGHTYMTQVRSDESTGVVPLVHFLPTVPLEAFGKGRVVAWCPHINLPDPVSVIRVEPADIQLSYSMPDRLIRIGVENVTFSQHVMRSNLRSRFDAQMAEVEPWTKMLLTNPPCTQAIISAKYEYEDMNEGHKTFTVVRTIRRDEGLTMFSIWEAVHEKGSIRIRAALNYDYIVSLNSQGQVVVTGRGHDDGKSHLFHEVIVETTTRELIDAFDRIGIVVSLRRGDGTELELERVVLPTEEEFREMQEKPHRTLAQTWHRPSLDIAKADPWTKMFLCNPPCNRVISDALYVGGRIEDVGKISVFMRRTVERSEGSGCLMS